MGATSLETSFLLLFPLCVFWGLNYNPIIQKNMLDPYVYTGYINNFFDLFHRYGTTYYSVRFGLILPGRISTWVFGPETGYFVLRYLLVVLFGVSLYFLLKRYLGATVAILVYVIAVSSPYLARAILWDHPDATAVPFMIAAICLMLWEDQHWRTLSFGAGCFAGMAIHSNFFALGIFGIFIVCHGSVWLIHRRPFGSLFRRWCWVAIGIGLVTLVGSAYYWKAVGVWNIFKPTIAMAVSLSSGGMKQWRNAGAGWTLRLFHVFVPVWLAVCCLAVSFKRPRTFATTVMLSYGLAITGFYYVHQFLLEADTLQLFYYFSYAIPAVFIMLALTGFRLWEQAHVPPLIFLGTSIPAFLTPWVLVSCGVDVFGKSPLRVFLVCAALSCVVIRAAVSVRSIRAVRLLAMVGMLLLMLSFDWGFSNYAPAIRARTSTDTSEMDVYHTALQLVARVPKLEDTRGHILFWYNNRIGNPINSVQSMYLWGYSKINHDPPQDPGLPGLTQEQIMHIEQPEVRYLGLLCESVPELSSGLQALRVHGVQFREVERRYLGAGGYRFLWELLQLEKL